MSAPAATLAARLEASRMSRAKDVASRDSHPDPTLEDTCAPTPTTGSGRSLLC